MTDLEKYFRHNDEKLIHKWAHYFDIYDRHFSKYRGKELTILEIGVSQGGSLQMWKNYFGDKVTVYGIDIDPRCKELEEDNIHIFIGSQSDRKFLQDVKNSIPKVDILIDDGGHHMIQQIVSYEELFGHIKDDGVYLIEDLHTSYWLKYGGGLRRKGTFIEYSKNFIDELNAYHSEQTNFKVNEFTKTVNSIHYYDSIIVIEKMPKSKPFSEMSGNLKFDNYAKRKEEVSSKIRPNTSFSKKFTNSFNKLLRAFNLPNINQQ